jgi:hypothetical protein
VAPRIWKQREEFQTELIVPDLLSTIQAMFEQHGSVTPLAGSCATPTKGLPSARNAPRQKEE